MEIILKNDMEKLGHTGEVVNVAPGYARNYLIPRGIAIEATRGNIRQFESERAGWEKKAEKLRGDANSQKDALEALSLVFKRKVGEEGKLFGSVTSMDLEAELKVQSFEIDRKKIVLGDPIKSLGSYRVAVKLHPGVKAELKVSVEDDAPKKAPVEEPAEAVVEAEAPAVETAQEAEAAPAVETAPEEA
ncbi:LSU ribosomal protein L9p [hydrothermal vent metagenome]|uniref:50S ribosomal protein L9 n=1 Tax=hydrothermal vent metagenome TaxID=652676 RepID=A0A3B0VG40_9ZZZZ